jgi:hypothetical protein
VAGRVRPVRLLVVSLGLASLGCIAGILIDGDWRAVARPQLAVLVGLTIAAAVAGHPGVARGSDRANAGTIARMHSPVLMASALLLTPPLAVVVAAIGEYFAMVRPLTGPRVVGNCAKGILSTAAGAVVWQLGGGPSLLLSGAHLNRAAGVAVLALLALNTVDRVVLVSLIRLATGAPWRQIQVTHVGSILEDIAQTSLGCAAALTVVHQAVMLIVLLPLA